MNQCPRCLKHTGEVGVHTCSPTEWFRKVEQQRDELWEALNYVMHSLTDGSPIDPEYIKQTLEKTK